MIQSNILFEGTRIIKIASLDEGLRRYFPMEGLVPKAIHLKLDHSQFLNSPEGLEKANFVKEIKFT